MGVIRFFLLVSLVLVLNQTPASAQQALTASLAHEIRVHEHGFVLIVERISLTNEGRDPAAVPPFIIQYPKKLYSSIATYSAEPASVLPLIQAEGDRTTVSVTPPQEAVLQPGKSVTYNITLILADAIVPKAKDEYTFFAPIVPAITLPVGKVTINIILPEKNLLHSPAKGFTQQGSKPVWTGSFDSVLAVQDVVFKAAVESTFTILSFPEARREIIVTPMGELLVRDQVKVLNLGNRSVANLKLVPLGGRLDRATIVPSTTPPLTAATPVEIKNNTLTVTSVYSRPIDRGEQRTITIEYPYPQNLVWKDAASIRFEASAKSPVEGVVKNLEFQTIYPKTYAAMPEKLALSKTNAGYLSGDVLVATIRPKIMWAAGEGFTLATVIFAASFSVLFLSRGVVGGEVSQRLRLAAGLRRSIEDKSAETQRLFADLASRQRGQTSRRDLEETRARLEDVRVKVSKRLAEAVEELGEEGRNVEKILRELLDADREYDREARGLFNAYRTYHTSTARGDSLRLAVDEGNRRFGKTSEKLVEQIERLTKELS